MHKKGGWLLALLAVAGFSGTLPMTRSALPYLPVEMLGPGRVWPAALVAAMILWLRRQPFPAKRHWPGLFINGLVACVAFPWFVATSLQTLHASHAAVILGLLPMVMALLGRFRHGERPNARFWFFALLGCGVLVHYAWPQQGYTAAKGDLYLVLAMFAVALSYSEGARLSNHLGSWQAMHWSMVFALPAALGFFPVVFTLENTVPWTAWVAYAYIALISQWLAYVCWYQAMTIAGVAAAGQMQLLQMFFTMAVSAVLLHEYIGTELWLHAVAVTVCIVFSRPVRFSFHP